MKKSAFTAGLTGLLLAAAALGPLTGCYSEPSGRSAYYRDRPIGYDASAVSYEDDYDYYPGYEVYYGRNRHEYVYRDGNRWVRTTQPRVSSQILMSAPSVRVEFRDAPERHHDSVARQYPRTWRNDRNRDTREWRDDNRNGINDYDERQYRDRR